MLDGVQHIALGLKELILLRQRHGESTGHTSRNDGNLMHRIRLRQGLHHYRMSGFVVCGQLPFLLGNHSRLLLRSRNDLCGCFFDFIHTNLGAVAACGQQCCLIYQILDIRRRESRCSLCQNFQRHILCQRFILCMYFENFFSRLYIRHADDNLAIESARSQQRRVQNIRTVGGCQDDNSGIFVKSVHLHQKLVQGLFSFVISAAQAGTSLPSYGIDFIDKNNARCILLCLLEEVTNTGSTHTDEHLHEIRTGNRKERYARFTCSGLGNVGFTGTRITHHQHTFRDPRSQLGIFSRIPKEVHNLLKFFLFLLEAGYILKGDALSVILIQFRPILSELEGLVVPALAHHKVEQENQRHHHDNRRQKREEVHAAFRRIAFQRNLVLLQHGIDVMLFHPADFHHRRRIGKFHVAVLLRSAELPICNVQRFIFLTVQLFHELGEFNLLRRSRVIHSPVQVRCTQNNHEDK